jgi:hypothetical protein
MGATVETLWSYVGTFWVVEGVLGVKIPRIFGRWRLFRFRGALCYAVSQHGDEKRIYVRMNNYVKTGLEYLEIQKH